MCQRVIALREGWAGLGVECGPPEDSFIRLTDDTAKLRRRMGVEAVVGRRATAGRRNLEAMVAVVVRCVVGGVRGALSGRV